MIRILSIILALIIPAVLSANSILFPTFNVYSELNSSNVIWTSYNIDMLVDTGLKYGVKIGLGMKNYQVSSMDSNFVNFSTLKVYANPIEPLFFGYFLGKNRTLGNAEIGYQGFQFHQRPHFEYVGYKDINGDGFEAYGVLFDGALEPHLYIYQPSFTNRVSLDTVTYLKFDTYMLELYLGINNLNLYEAYVKNNLQKRIGVFIKTIFGKIDFMMGLYLPDAGLFDVPTADEISLNVTEHFVYNNFEQTLSLFTRPSYYNGYKETVTNDVDFYMALGGRIDTLGFGAENTFTMAGNYGLADRAGVYFYYLFNTLQMKTGFYYGLFGTAFPSQYGFYMNLTGNL